MVEQALKAEAQKLVAHIECLGSRFKILKAQPASHIGAIMADAVLQVRHRWKTHVEKRVKRIESNYPGAATLSGLSKLLATEGAQRLLDWNGTDEQGRFRQTIEFFSNEKVDGITIDTVSQLRKWLESEDNRDRLLTTSSRSDKAGIPKIGDKTADYYRVMVGLRDAVAIDSLIRAFLRDAGVRGGQYHRARAIVQLAAQMLSGIRNTSIRPIDLDQSIWRFQSESVIRAKVSRIKAGKVGRYGEATVQSVTPAKVSRIKEQLADKYIEDPEEKCLFFTTTEKDIHDWGCYIAGLVLTQRGRTLFERKHITSELRQLIPGYNGMYLKESTLLPADVCWNCAPSSAGFEYPCLEAVKRSSRPYTYKFIGFKEAIRKKFGDSQLRKMLDRCPQV